MRAMMPRRSRHVGGAAAAWAGVAVVLLAAAVPPLRLPVLGVVALVTAWTMVGARGRVPSGPGVAWLALLPIAVSLVIGLMPDQRVPNPGACDDLLAPPVVRRALQAAVVLGVVALLAIRLGGPASLGIRLPPDRRVTALAAASPILVPIGLVVGPLLAVPFFGEVRLGLPSPGALLPAAVLGVANAALEEVAYRGAVQRWGAPALGRGGAIVAQALVFGTAHLGSDIEAGAPLIWAGMVAAGLAAGLIADRTRSLLLPFAVHAAVDVPLALALTCRLA